MQEKYTLAFQDYSEHLRDMMKELILRDDFTDVTLVTEDKKHIKAHKNILSACSPVFRQLVTFNIESNTIIYLRGINFPELESIMQFIYLGETTFYEERMNEVLSVAKSLEIKGLHNTNPVDDEYKDFEFDQCDEWNTEENSDINKHERHKDQLKQQINHMINIDSKKENIKYSCDQCDTQATTKYKLKQHIESKHEGNRYACDHCNYQAKEKSALKKHIESIHECIRYACDQCDYQTTWQSILKRHIQSKHEGVKYSCDQCDYQASRKDLLRNHNKARHEGLKC